MTFDNILKLFGGLALFLYGIHMVNSGLGGAARNRMKTILERLTSDRFLGIIMGVAITAVIQSSSATIVMVIGFVNSQLVTLNQAVWIIMGANIDTVIIGQLIALDAPETTPLVTIFDVVLIMSLKNKKVNTSGEVFVGLGILLIGMDMMEGAMVPLQQGEAFIHTMTTTSNPVLATLLGASFTALIQSSSAPVDTLQALAISGLIPLNNAIRIISGQNIGTCIASVLTSLGTSRDAKRVIIIHLSFNVIDTIAFMTFAALVPFAPRMESATSNPTTQITNTHTISSIATTLLLISFDSRLARLMQVTLPVKQKKIESAGYSIPLTFVDKDNIGSVPIATSPLRRETMAIPQLTETSPAESMSVLCGNTFSLERARKCKRRVDYINYEITNYATLVNSLKTNESDSMTCNTLYKYSSDIERISDHIINVIQYSTDKDNKLSSSKYIKDEPHQLASLLSKSSSLLSIYSLDSQDECFEKIEQIENRIDKLTAGHRQA